MGTGKAEKERVPGILYSTVAGQRLYEKAELRVVGEWAWAKGGEEDDGYALGFTWRYEVCAW